MDEYLSAESPELFDLLSSNADQLSASLDAQPTSAPSTTTSAPSTLYGAHYSSDEVSTLIKAKQIHRGLIHCSQGDCSSGYVVVEIGEGENSRRHVRVEGKYPVPRNIMPRIRPYTLHYHHFLLFHLFFVSFVWRVIIITSLNSSLIIV